jgi:indole-3-glycerol phosphate synthase
MSETNLLDAIVAGARRAAADRLAASDRSALDAAVRSRPPRGQAFRASLQQPGARVIAECKRRSPSRGVLRDAYDPVSIARGYAEAGAAAISVLTEPAFFSGALDHLRAVRQAVSTPLLQKDFVVTEFQIVEAASAGADAILLIVAALDDDALARLLKAARSFGLAALVEVHDAEELARAIDAGADLIGVNSRNLRTLHVDTSVLDALGPAIPPTAVAVAESGLKTASDLIRLRQIRYNAFLMGERFMIEPDPGAALARVRDEVERPWGV